MSGDRRALGAKVQGALTCRGPARSGTTVTLSRQPPLPQLWRPYLRCWAQHRVLFRVGEKRAEEVWGWAPGTQAQLPWPSCREWPVSVLSQVKSLGLTSAPKKAAG